MNRDASSLNRWSVIARSLAFAMAAVTSGCLSNGSPDESNPCGITCGRDEHCAYEPGCVETRVCAPNTCGDAARILFCGCDGVTFVTGCLYPARPYAHRGSCEEGNLDAGVDGE